MLSSCKPKGNVKEWTTAVLCIALLSGCANTAVKDLSNERLCKEWKSTRPIPSIRVIEAMTTFGLSELVESPVAVRHQDLSTEIDARGMAEQCE